MSEQSGEGAIHSPGQKQRKPVGSGRTRHIRTLSQELILPASATLDSRSRQLVNAILSSDPGNEALLEPDRARWPQGCAGAAAIDSEGCCSRQRAWSVDQALGPPEFGVKNLPPVSLAESEMGLGIPLGDAHV